MKTLLGVVVVLAVAAQEKQEKKEDPRFERIKKLAGDWAAADDKEGKVLVTYRVTAGGSAVVETLFVGTDHEMMTVYTMDGGDLVLTHYCVAGNQPTMKAAMEMKGDALPFSCAKVGNAKSHDDGHMHSLTMTFSGADGVTHAWGWSQDGKDGGAKTFSLKRRK